MGRLAGAALAALAVVTAAGCGADPGGAQAAGGGAMPNDPYLVAQDLADALSLDVVTDLREDPFTLVDLQTPDPSVSAAGHAVAASGEGSVYFPAGAEGLDVWRFTSAGDAEVWQRWFERYGGAFGQDSVRCQNMVLVGSWLDQPGQSVNRPDQLTRTLADLYTDCRAAASPATGAGLVATVEGTSTAAVSTGPSLSPTMAAVLRARDVTPTPSAATFLGDPSAETENDPVTMPPAATPARQIRTPFVDGWAPPSGGPSESFTDAMEVVSVTLAANADAVTVAHVVVVNHASSAATLVASAEIWNLSLTEAAAYYGDGCYLFQPGQQRTLTLQPEQLPSILNPGPEWTNFSLSSQTGPCSPAAPGYRLL
ncbi:hypothetical protein AB1460_24625 [Parafrankia sp. FMc2]